MLLHSLLLQMSEHAVNIRPEQLMSLKRNGANAIIMTSKHQRGEIFGTLYENNLAKIGKSRNVLNLF